MLTVQGDLTQEHYTHARPTHDREVLIKEVCSNGNT
jgi:hypothetical protein